MLYGQHQRKVAARQGICRTCSHQFLDHKATADGFTCTLCKCISRFWRGRKGIV